MHSVVKVTKPEANSPWHSDEVVFTSSDLGEAVDKAQALGRAYRKANPGDYSITYKVR